MVQALHRQIELVRSKGHQLRQVSNDLVELFHHAVVAQKLLQEFSGQVAAASGGQIVTLEDTGERVPMKHFWRALEKAAYASKDSCSGELRVDRVIDIARDAIEFKDYFSMGSAMEFLSASDIVDVVRIKDRISSVENATALGWTDIVVTLRFHADPHGHLCELQLFHETSRKCRTSLGGHIEYVQLRTICELFNANGAPAPI